MENQVDVPDSNLEKVDFYYSDEKAAKIAENFSYDGYQIVRREMFAHMGVPSVTIRNDSITFNTACIKSFEDVVYIQVMVSRKQKRLVIRRCEENDKDALRWCVKKNDARKTRKIIGRQFTKMLYEMMSWNRGCRYKITGHRINFEGEELFVFELQEPEIFKERPKRTAEEQMHLAETMTAEELETLKKQETAASRKPFYPEDVENTFGVPVKEHENHPVLGSLEEYTGMSSFSNSEEVDAADSVDAGGTDND